MIRTELVLAVLLADGWYEVESDTFCVDEDYRYAEKDNDGTSIITRADPPTPFVTCAAPRTARTELISGPLSSILAIRYKEIFYVLAKEFTE